MKTSHTPGPWKIEHERNRFDSSFDTLAIVEGKEDGRIVLAHLNVRAFAPHLAEPEANARLIAAAPELLATAVELLRAHDAQYGKLIAGSTAFADAYLALHNAIAKATQP